MIKNWQTALSGLAAIAAVGWKAYHGTLSQDDIAIIFAGIGLLRSKDKNVTGGSKPQTPEAADRVATDQPTRIV